MLATIGQTISPLGLVFRVKRAEACAYSSLLGEGNLPDVDLNIELCYLFSFSRIKLSALSFSSLIFSFFSVGWFGLGASSFTG